MPWIRLSDNYMEDEKIDALSNGAFRLWHAGMAYCRRNSTDGLIPFSIIKGFKSFTKRREKELSLSIREGLSPLWTLVPGMGYNVSNYLKYNLSKEEEQSDRSAATARMRKFRDGVRDASQYQPRDAFVPVPLPLKKEKERLERESERKPDARSKRPIFTGNRLTVFEWQLDECINNLGPHIEEFGLDEWFWQLDAMAVHQGLVLPKRDGGEWLQAQLLAECKRRGIPLKLATAKDAGPTYEEKLRADAAAMVQMLREQEKAGLPQ
jgi:hypothetical protein